MARVEQGRAVLARALSVAVPLFAMYNVWYPWPALRERAFFALLLTSIMFLRARKKGTVFWLLFDTAHLVIAVVVFGYLFWFWEPVLDRIGLPTTTDMILGGFGIYLALMATLKIVGRALAFVVLLFLAYVFFGQHLPTFLAGHTGFSLMRIFTFTYLSENGMMGFPIMATLKYMVLFLLLGKVLKFTGALDFIMDLSRAVFSRGKTGPPLMAVFSSALVGSIIGSGTANVFITGQITIPLMKRIGMKPHDAAATEAAASTGGQIMPPVMGFAVFFMIVLLQIDYIDVVRAAFIPALLYFLSVGAGVWFRARQVKTAPDETFYAERPRVRDTLLRASVLSFVVALGLLVFLLMQRASLQFTAMYSMAAAFGISFLGRDRYTPRKALATLEETGRDVVTLAAASIVMGIIVGIVLLTGLGVKLPTLMIGWAGGSLVLLLLFTMLASIILGTGVPTSMAYLIVAIVVSKALTTAGVPILHAHLFVFYASMAAMLTPPVALTAYAAATIAETDYWRTGLVAFIIGMPKFLVPFAFVFRPELLTEGSLAAVVGVSLLTAAGLVALSTGFAIERRGPAKILSALLVSAGGFMIVLTPIGMLTIVGGALCAAGAWPIYRNLAVRLGLIQRPAS